MPSVKQKLKSHCLIFCSVLERDSGRLYDSMARLLEAENLHVSKTTNASPPRLGVGNDSRTYCVCEQRVIQRSGEFITEIRFEFEAIGHHRMAAIVESNLGFLLLNVSFHEQSEIHLLRSRRFFDALSDNLRVAQVNETLTRLYMLNGTIFLSKTNHRECGQALELTHGEAVLSESVTTNGIVACRLHRYKGCQEAIGKHNVSERCGDRERGRKEGVWYV